MDPLARTVHPTSPASSGPPRDRPPGPAPPPPPWWRAWILPLGLAVTLWLLLPLLLGPAPQLTYTEFLRRVDRGRVESVTIDSNGEATGTLEGGDAFSTAIPIELAGDRLLRRLEQQGVAIKAVPQRASLFSILL